MNIFKKLFTKRSTETEVVSETVEASPETIEEALIRLKATEQDLKIFSLVEAKLFSGEYEVAKNVEGVSQSYFQSKYYSDWSGGWSAHTHYLKIKISSKWYRVGYRVELYPYTCEDFYSILNRDVFSTGEVEQLICKHWFTFLSNQRMGQLQLLEQKKKEEKERIKALQVEECIKTLEGV